MSLQKKKKTILSLNRCFEHEFLMVFLPNWLSTGRNQGTRQVEYCVWLTLLLSEQAKMKPRLKSSLLPWPRLWQAWWLCSAGLRKCGGQTWLAQASRQSHARCTEGGFLFIRVTYLKKWFSVSCDQHGCSARQIVYWTLLNTVLVFSAKREGCQSPSHSSEAAGL